MHRIRGIYVPSCFNVIYQPDGTVDAIEPLIAYYRFVEKALIPDIEEYPFPDRQVVPFTGLVHDRLAVEISRGCTRGCRFCQAGMTYRPVRERAPESILETSEKALRLTGYDDISLLSLSSGDYSSIGPLLTALMDRQSNNKVAVSLPSLRIDTLDAPLMEQIKRVRKTGFTLAPEAGNDRLRTIINKGLRQKDILETARAVYGMGWNLIKLYFMIGLPFEEENDLQDIINLAKQIVGQAGRKGKRAKLNVSISTFVPKSHTPFMWYPQITSKESRRRIQFIRNGLKGSPVRVKWNQPELSWLEGIFSRGDRRLSRALVEAWRLGARFDAWGECFRVEIWKKAFKATGVNPDFYLHRKRSPSETMPWDHIKSGVTNKYLKKEWEKAQSEIQTPDCREKCLECGVCDHKIVDPVLFKDWDSPGMKNLSTAPPIPESRKYCLTFTKLDHARYLGHLELVSVFIRALKRAGLNLVYSRGFHPMPKVSFACALPVGTESIQETVDIEVAGKGDIASLKNIINRQLPDGISVTSVDEVPHNRKRQLLLESHFLMTLNGLELKKDDLDRFLMSDDFPVVKINKKGEHKINARPLVKSLKLISPDEIELVIQHLSGPQLKPAEIVKSIFTLKDSQATGIKILKTRQILE
jgi:radical SAM-linked protein